MNSFNNIFLIKNFAKSLSLVDCATNVQCHCYVTMKCNEILHQLNERGAQKGLRGKVKPMRIAQHGIATIVTQQWQIAGMVPGHSSF